MKSVIATILTSLLLLLVVGCAAGKSYVNEDADLGFYSRVGVMPFANLSSETNAAEKVTSTFVTELLSLGAMQVANPGDFVGTVREVLKGSESNLFDDLTSAQTQQIGELANVEGIFVGQIKSYGMVRTGQNQFPQVGLIVRFIDCPTGTIVWSYETSRVGGPKFPIFSFGETHTLGDMTVKVCREVLSSFGDIAR